MLKYFSHINVNKENISDLPEKSYIKAQEIVYRPSGAKFSKKWRNFDPIKKDEIIWESNQWIYTAPYDGMILYQNQWGMSEMNGIIWENLLINNFMKVIWQNVLNWYHPRMLFSLPFSFRRRSFLSESFIEVF